MRKNKIVQAVNAVETDYGTFVYSKEPSEIRALMNRVQAGQHWIPPQECEHCGSITREGYYDFDMDATEAMETLTLEMEKRYNGL